MPPPRLSSSLASLMAQLPHAPRGASASTPILPQRRLQCTSTTKSFPSSTLPHLRKHQVLDNRTTVAAPQLLRFASSSSAASPPHATTSFPPAPSITITWNDYLALRKTRRRYNLTASILTSLGTTSAGVTVLSQQNFEHLGGLFGLDPFIVLGLATAGSGAVGWLLGPFVGNAVFGMIHRRVGGQIAEVSDGPMSHTRAKQVEGKDYEVEWRLIYTRCSRRRKISIGGSSDTESTPRANLFRTRYPTTMARRLGVWASSGIGWRISGHITKRDRASCEENRREHKAGISWLGGAW